jgi:type I restriction enzyme S subunit
MTYEGNCRLGDLFTSRREKGRPGLPTLSVTLNDGLVNREDLDRKQDTTLTPEQHLLVKPGDIAYNTMRMWQGAFGLASNEGMVSPAYVVVKAKRGVDPLYASYLLKNSRMLYLLWAYSHGLTEDRLRLYFDDFARIPAKVPDDVAQKKIAQILETWDDAIEKASALVANSRKQKTALMQQLLFQKKRVPKYSSPWSELKLGECLRVIKRPIEWDDEKLYPLISVRRNSEGAFHRESLFGHQILTKNLKIAHKGDLLISKMQVVHGAMAIVPPVLDGMYVSGSYLTLRSSDESRYSTRFIGWLFSSRSMYKLAYRCSYGVHIEKMTFDFDMFLNERIRLPRDVEEQNEICLVLEKAQTLLADSEERLECLQTEKAALMQMLFKV